jgi:hypothetical protein
VHLDTVLKFQAGQSNPLAPDRRDALSYIGGEAANNVGQASRLPRRQEQCQDAPAVVSISPCCWSLTTKRIEACMMLG